ncbi:MAG: hypothetical protein KDA98_03550 [Acidimicrobiales bacterium]|nr:hypothetical protein [Acidimicrobiales bacterium]
MAARSPRSAVRRRGAVAVAATVLLAGGALAACSSDGDDVDADGARDQAIEQLVDFGLDQDQATCVVDRLGADAVVEAADLTALAESQDYRDAATACTGDG